ETEPAHTALPVGGVVRHGHVARRRVSRVVAGQRLEHERRIARGARHRTQVIEREDVRAYAGEADPAVSRLEPPDPAQRGRIADGATRARAEGERAESRRHRRGRTAARASRYPVEVPRVAGRAIVRIDGGRGRGELVRE